jgi:ribosome modulation factor
MPKGELMSDSDTAVPATAGSTVEVCPFTGTSKQGAALLAEIDEKHAVLVGLEHEVAFGDALAIRYWDGDLAAYQVSARVSDPNPTVERTELLLLGTWKTLELRRGQRIPMPRLSLVAEARDDAGKVTRRFQLVAADLSGVGCGVTGVGPPPSVGGELFLRAGDVENAPWIPVNVRRISPRGFGSWSAGLEFQPTTSEEREWLLAWRDAAADAVRAA